MSLNLLRAYSHNILRIAAASIALCLAASTAWAHTTAPAASCSSSAPQPCPAAGNSMDAAATPNKHIYAVLEYCRTQEGRYFYTESQCKLQAAFFVTSYKIPLSIKNFDEKTKFAEQQRMQGTSGHIQPVQNYAYAAGWQAQHAMQCETFARQLEEVSLALRQLPDAEQPDALHQRRQELLDRQFRARCPNADGTQ